MAVNHWSVPTVTDLKSVCHYQTESDKCFIPNGTLYSRAGRSLVRLLHGTARLEWEASLPPSVVIRYAELSSLLPFSYIEISISHYCSAFAHAHTPINKHKILLKIEKKISILVMNSTYISEIITKSIYHIRQEIRIMFYVTNRNGCLYNIHISLPRIEND